eukprot:9532889-Alexandrium_andersonii.AAC.1
MARAAVVKAGGRAPAARASGCYLPEPRPAALSSRRTSCGGATETWRVQRKWSCFWWPGCRTG